MTSSWQKLAHIRREYGNKGVDEHTLHTDPIEQFKLWFTEAQQHEQDDPTAMVLSTVDEQGFPDSRMVLLKGLEEQAFIFYTNYDSQKGKQLAHLPYAALNFYWPKIARQVRIRGHVAKVSEAMSDTYFLSRPFMSQISVYAAVQSAVIPNRQYLEERVQEQMTHANHQTVSRPPNWGGYAVVPDAIEFWQGRDNRLHDRILFTKENHRWHRVRLAP